MLECEGIDVFYDDLQALWGVSLSVEAGEIVALIGSNGAGKTTILRTIAGLSKPAKGDIKFDGVSLSKKPAYDIVDLGIALVPEGRKLFGSMTVLENLELGAFTGRARGEKNATMKWVYEVFPLLEERRNQTAVTLSGGQQQMLAIGRALMSQPKLLLLDEPSLGLAPLVVQMIFDVIEQINQRGVSVLLVEQNAHAALERAARAYVVENGRVVGHDTGQNMLRHEHVKSAYLGGV
ncbi:MAG: ABC transporter ATP-binding protein [Chloroflexi bacterium]|nr:ABC transporter ATP-binding protein [Chloroflexota bacterium]MDA8188857.1 ABC transporter ATP-binding protein [Dehalococcoidales bacterium]